jgi:hypothetical protein
MDPLFQLSLATLIFVATHFVASTPLRAALVRSLGENVYLDLYSLVAAASLAWMGIAYASTPRGEPLWSAPLWLPAAVMPFALVLLVCGYFRNTTAERSERLLKSDDPARGMIRVTRHPLMWAIMLWAGAHAGRGLAALRRGDLAPAVRRDCAGPQPLRRARDRREAPADRPGRLRRAAVRAPGDLRHARVLMRASFCAY